MGEYLTLSYFTGEQRGDPNAIMAYANDAVFKEENLCIGTDCNAQIKLKGNKYCVGKGEKRFLWLATRMGMPTVKDAPGFEVIQTYNLSANRL